MTAPAAKSAEELGPRIPKETEPSTRPEDPSWHWNGYYWHFPHSELDVAIYPRGGSGFFANVIGDFSMTGPERSDGESAAADAIRMIDYVRALQSELANRVVVPLTVQNRRVISPR